MINNFLTSGFTFTKDQYELKLQYQYFNLLLFLNMTAVSLAGCYRFYRGEMIQGVVDTVYTLVSVLLIVLVRKYKERFTTFVKVALVIAYITTSLTFIVGATNLIGLGWYFLLILTVSFLADKRFSYIIFILSLLTITVTVVVKNGVEYIWVLPFSLIPFIVFMVFVGLYNKRNTLQKGLLEEKNKLLETYTFNLENYDPVTNLPNRNLFLQNLQEKIDASKAQASEFAVLKLEIDNYKSLCDYYGHKFGEKVLLEIANRLQAIVLRKENLSNIGGMEFITVVNLSQPTKLMRLANKIQNALKAPMVINEQKIFTTCSIGIALYDKDGQDVPTLMKNVDTALHNATQMNIGGLEFYNSKQTESLTENLDTLRHLKDALENKEFEVYFQPQIDASIEKLIGMEALVRWNNPKRGLVSPDSFIPLAESYGLIDDIDFFVMKSAMQSYVKWREEFGDIGKLALNLSLKVLENGSYIEDLKAMMNVCSFEASWLELEVTEGHLMHDAQKSIEMLKELNAMGIEIAVDDFGTGYSSLAYLQKLPVNKLKIDRSFITDIPQDSDGAALAQSIISISKALKLGVIAEGVENIAQKEFLLENGCHNIQGYLYAKPMDVEAMTLFIRRLQK